MTSSPNGARVVVRSPLAGRVVLPVAVPDPVFAQEVLGPGTAIDPGAQERGAVLAPVSGTVASLHPHAFVVQGEGVTVLVHVGIDTITCKGEGFAPLVAVDDQVRAGDPVLTWEPADVAARGLSTMCPVVLLDAGDNEVRTVPEVGAPVAAGDPLLVVERRAQA